MHRHARWRYLCALSALSGLFAAAPGLAAPLTVEYVDSAGREWASLAETTNVSFNQVSAVCSTDGQTACTGDIGVLGTTGWIFATRNQVRDLFVDFGIAASDIADYSHSEIDSAWAPAVFNAFTMTTTIGGNPQLLGLTSTVEAGLAVRLGNLIDRGPGVADHAEVGPVTAPDTARADYGVFLFRNAAPVTPIPEPATGVLLLGGLIAARLARRRH